MSEVSRLLLKALHSLPQEEQDTLLEAMFEGRLSPALDAASMHHLYAQHPPMQVSLGTIGGESGGPWQSAPVRLSTEQHERLKQWCQANGFTMAVVLRGLVARFLDDHATRRPRPPEAPRDTTAQPSRPGHAGAPDPVPGAPESGG